MRADQAAGLRRRNDQQPLHGIYCFFDSAELTCQLAQALHRHGRTLLLVDTGGRLFANSPTRSLFDWKQQLERGQLHIQPMAWGDGWHAPGIRADLPALRRVAHRYDHVVFDMGTIDDWLALMTDAIQTMVVEVHATHESKLRAYTLIKTLAGSRDSLGVNLLGDLAACEQVRHASRHFLDARLAQAIYIMAQEEEAFAALAVRMPPEETGLTTRHINRKNLKHGQ